MTNQSWSIPASWERRDKPPMLSRRFTFAAYVQTRRFLDALAAWSEAHGVHPHNISFGATYVNVALDARNPDGLDAEDARIARSIEALYDPGQV
jgi:pterin-4a-carbinolamine dehydratase